MSLIVSLVHSSVPLLTVGEGITPVGIPGVDTVLTKILGWGLWILAVLALAGLLAVFAVGFESYKHGQAEDFMQKGKAWTIAAIVGANAKQIVQIFFPTFTANIVSIEIPGMKGPVQDVLGNVVWALQWAAFACIIFLAIRGFIAFKNDGVAEFVSKFYWFIVGALGTSLVTNIAGAFFPAALDFGTSTGKPTGAELVTTLVPFLTGTLS